ncbi:hypothetical protein GEMRC1_000665 [Eukaryota sp. GEM-RC1]
MIWYQGGTDALFVGVIDESKFRVSGCCYENAHCFENNRIHGCLSGPASRWKPGEFLEVKVNLITHTLTIKSVGKSSINMTGTLPRLISGNYYTYASLCCRNQALEIVE